MTTCTHPETTPMTELPEASTPSGLQIPSATMR
jgi:hypothetical protein